MKIQSISNEPNFKGNVFFAGQSFISSDIKNMRERIPASLRDAETQLRALIKDEPFDLFIYKAKKQPEFFQLEANINYHNIIMPDSKERAARHMFVSETMPSDSYIDMAKSAINEYKIYLKKNQNLFARMINKLKKIL